MDSLLRKENRERGLKPMPMPVPVVNNPRPPLANQPRQSNADVVDLTGEDNSRTSKPLNGYMPVPSSQQSGTRTNMAIVQPGSSAVRPLPELSMFARSKGGVWQLPPKDKHSEPSKVRMFDPTRTSVPSKMSADAPLPSSSYRSAATKQHVGRQLMRDGVEVMKHVIKDGFARLEHALDEANGSSSTHSHAKPTHTQSHESDDEDGPPLASSFAGPTLTAEEREQQLQDMLSSMVLPPELGDIDLEKASNVNGLQCKLMPHQVAGYLWLKGREGGKYKGGILADDMGLGKTVQMLALMVGNAPTLPDTTINKIRSEPEQAKKSKKKVIPDSDEGPPEEKVEIKSKTTLIVAPLAVIRQWEREIKEKTSPNLKVLVHHGASRTKVGSTFTKYDVVITTYPTVASEWNNVAGAEKPKTKKGTGAKGGRKNVIPDSSEDEDDDDDRASIDNDSDGDDSFEGPITKKKSTSKKAAPATKKMPPSPLFEVDWLRIILDEAQNIKNHRTKASGACAALSRRALSKWCLSGTPIQNEAIEMFSLIRFLAIPPFNEYGHFREKIADPLKSTNQNRVNWGMKRLCAVLTTIMLRRTKDTVHDGKPILSLPNRKVEVISTDFDDAKERAFYEDLENQVKRNFEDAEEAGKKMNHMVSLLMLLRLRQACSHPSLVNRNVRVDAGAASGGSTAIDGAATASGLKANDDGSDDDGLTELLAGLSVKTKRCDRCQVDMSADEIMAGNAHCSECVERIRRDGNASSWEGKSSTKIRTMLRILREIEASNKEEKTIIFSQFTSFLDLVEPFLRREGRLFVRYDGSMRPDERERALDRIRSDPKVKIILISFKAGNVGLNLTCCSRVILMDLWWNPMLEAQSIDRAHRLGQQRDVHVYKLVINQSVEERILTLQDKKRALAEAALEGSKLSKANRLDKKELMYLFRGGPVA